MVINALRNKRCGPGGGTRHLHQVLPDVGKSPLGDKLMGVKQDRHAW